MLPVSQINPDAQLRSGFSNNNPGTANIENVINYQNSVVEELGIHNTEHTDAMMVNFSANSIPPTINVPVIADSKFEVLKRCTVNSKVLAGISEAINEDLI